MMIEVGGMYKTKSGRIVGPMRRDSCGDFHQIGCIQVWRTDGTVWGEVGDESGEYIVEKLTVSTTTKQTFLSAVEQLAAEYDMLIYHYAASDDGCTVSFEVDE